MGGDRIRPLGPWAWFCQLRLLLLVGMDVMNRWLECKGVDGITEWRVFMQNTI